MTRTRTAARPSRLLLLAPLALLLLVLTGCGPGGGSSGSGTDSAGGSTADPRSGPSSTDSGTTTEEVAPGAPDDGRSVVGASAARPALERAVVATGEVSVVADDVGTARDEALRLTRGWGGLVADEQTSSDDRGRPTDSTLVLRVPTPRFSPALEDLAGLGRVVHQTRSAEDVTTQVVDTQARVRAAERSIRSIERLLSRAVELGDVIRIESDLARRQADLDSLKQQQAYLADQTSLSTITLHLQRTAADEPAREETRGFLAGLDAGWDAMAGSAVALATVVGALLPFAALLALLGLPVVLALRRRRTQGVTAGV
ncbi:DUF4349 domain-containing protein [Nocardioides aurantiacus]|uniref:Uncharacterized protein DUF4349 n=1 Tax=Nocardioides aurantiacus TaxID=86796 RepID=A0A3N2CSJ1_9ACTN|nr:DUF4349 domain-containing protein [Nocardioides aurantiacus]ROR90489.1 uncharacterized protein DUF4349 [Nocardioides aurantiacus]